MRSSKVVFSDRKSLPSSALSCVLPMSCVHGEEEEKVLRGVGVFMDQESISAAGYDLCPTMAISFAPWSLNVLQCKQQE